MNSSETMSPALLTVTDLAFRLVQAVLLTAFVYGFIG